MVSHAQRSGKKRSEHHQSAIALRASVNEKFLDLPGEKPLMAALTYWARSLRWVAWSSMRIIFGFSF